MRHARTTAVALGVIAVAATAYVLLRPRYEYVWKGLEALPSAVNTLEREEYEPNITPDGKYLIFTRGKAGRNADLFMLPLDSESPAEALPLGDVNTEYDEIDGMLGSDGNLYFYSDRPGSLGGYDLYAAPRLENGRFGEPVNLGPNVNSSFNDYDPCLTRDGRLLYFSSNRHSAGSEEDYDLYVCLFKDGEWSSPKTLESLNTSANEWEPMLDRSGKTVYFTSNRARDDGSGAMREDYDLYAATLGEEGWGVPRNLGDRINSTDDEFDPCLSPQSDELLYVRGVRSGDSYVVDIWQGGREAIPIGPILQPGRVPSQLVKLLILVVSALVLFMLLVYWWKRLTTLQKCMVGSVAVHCLVAWILTLVTMTAEFDELGQKEATFVIYTDLPEDVEQEDFVATMFEEEMAVQVSEAPQREVDVPDILPDVNAPVEVTQQEVAQPDTSAIVPLWRESPVELTELQAVRETDLAEKQPVDEPTPLELDVPDPQEVPESAVETVATASQPATPALESRPLEPDTTPTQTPDTQNVPEAAELAELAMAREDVREPAEDRRQAEEVLPVPEASSVPETAVADSPARELSRPSAEPTQVAKSAPEMVASVPDAPSMETSEPVELAAVEPYAPPPVISTASLRVDQPGQPTTIPAKVETGMAEPIEPAFSAQPPAASRLPQPAATPAKLKPAEGEAATPVIELAAMTSVEIHETVQDRPQSENLPPGRSPTPVADKSIVESPASELPGASPALTEPAQTTPPTAASAPAAPAVSTAELVEIPSVETNMASPLVASTSVVVARPSKPRTVASAHVAGAVAPVEQALAVEAAAATRQPRPEMTVATVKAGEGGGAATEPVEMRVRPQLTSQPEAIRPSAVSPAVPNRTVAFDASTGFAELAAPVPAVRVGSTSLAVVMHDALAPHAKAVAVSGRPLGAQKELAALSLPSESATARAAVADTQEVLTAPGRRRRQAQMALTADAPGSALGSIELADARASAAVAPHTGPADLGKPPSTPAADLLPLTVRGQPTGSNQVPLADRPSSAPRRVVRRSNSSRDLLPASPLASSTQVAVKSPPRGFRPTTDTSTARIPRFTGRERVATMAWGPAENLGDHVNTAGDDRKPNLSFDAETLLLTRNAATGDADIFISCMEEHGWSPTDAFQAINSGDDEVDAQLDASGTRIVLHSKRPGGLGGRDLYMAVKEDDQWLPPVNLGLQVNSEFDDSDPCLSQDGRTLVFASNRDHAGSPENYDIFVSRAAADGEWGKPVKLPFNTERNDWQPALSADGLSLYFASNREGGRGGYDIWVSHRRHGEWQMPMNVGGGVNTAADELDPTLYANGRTLLFSSDRQGGEGSFDIWEAERTLILPE